MTGGSFPTRELLIGWGLAALYLLCTLAAQSWRAAVLRRAARRILPRAPLSTRMPTPIVMPPVGLPQMPVLPTYRGVPVAACKSCGCEPWCWERAGRG